MHQRRPGRHLDPGADLRLRALVYDEYGPIDRLHLADVPEPVLTGAQAIVDVRCAALNPKDALFRKGRFRLLSGSRFPKRTGLDYAGVVRASAPSLGLLAGQRVFGALNEWRYGRGTLADRVVVGPREVAPLPDSLEFETGAALALVGLTSLQALRDVAKLERGQRVAIHGASGGVGTIAIQIARALGASVMTTSSPRNVSLCRSLGADEAASYEDAPFAGRRHEFDCVFDAFGNLGYGRAAGALRPGGTYVTTVPSLRAAVHEVVSRVTGGGRRLVVVRPNRKDLETLATWACEGRIRPVIDARLSLPEFGEAFRLLESKRTRGKIVLALG